MELQESREYKAAKELERALNDMNFAERLLTVGYWMIVTCLLYNVMRGHLFI